MEIDQLIKSIANEKKKAESDLHSAEGLLRLQEVAAQYQGEYELVWSTVLLEELKKRPKKSAFETKITLLDGIIGGFHEQQLITLSASTKHGKTTMALFLMENLEALNPVMIPLEQSNEELVEQRESNGYSIPRFLSPRKLAAQVTVDWIEQRVIEGIAKYNTKLVVIDHLGYINTFGTDGKYLRENLAYRIGQVMRELKNMAKRWNVVVLLLVPISQHDEGKPPTLEDIKNSSDIIQESDMVVMLWRKNTAKKKVRVYENKTLISVMANRRTGKNGNVGLTFDSETGKYIEKNGWVKSMEEAASREVEIDDDFNTT